jgi:hypothetical protein
MKRGAREALENITPIHGKNVPRPRTIDKNAWTRHRRCWVLFEQLLGPYLCGDDWLILRRVCRTWSVLCHLNVAGKDRPSTHMCQQNVRRNIAFILPCIKDGTRISNRVFDTDTCVPQRRASVASRSNQRIPVTGCRDKDPRKFFGRLSETYKNQTRRYRNKSVRQSARRIFGQKIAPLLNISKKHCQHVKRILFAYRPIKKRKKTNDP